MARRRAKLSAAFLKRARARLDAIGPWEVEADTLNLDIVWRRPAALADGRGGWDLRFHTDADSPTFDPDERMFELWEAYRAHHPRVADRLRKRLGPVEDLLVEVARGYGDGEPGYRVRVVVSVGDGEHSWPFVVDPQTGRLEDEDTGQPLDE